MGSLLCVTAKLDHSNEHEEINWRDKNDPRVIGTYRRRLSMLIYKYPQSCCKIFGDQPEKWAIYNKKRKQEKG